MLRMLGAKVQALPSPSLWRALSSFKRHDGYLGERFLAKHVRVAPGLFWHIFASFGHLPRGLPPGHAF